MLFLMRYEAFAIECLNPGMNFICTAAKESFRSKMNETLTFLSEKGG